MHTNASIMQASWNPCQEHDATTCTVHQQKPYLKMREHQAAMLPTQAIPQ